MQLNHDIIKTLLLKEISGDITVSEAAMLKQALEADEEVRELARQIRNKVSVEDVYSYFLTNDKHDFTEAVVGKIHQRKKKKLLLRYISISAAASLIIFAGIWYFSFNRVADPHSADMASVVAPNSIILSLPDGKRLALDSTDQQLQRGNVTISTRSRTLSYITNDAGAAAEYATLTVPAGKDYKIQLKDGSEIHLNAATKLRFPLTFNGNRREVTIDGEAYIKVAPNTQKPFIVHLPKGTVEVLGTEFNINTYDIAVQRISLVAGSVRVKTATDSVLLKPGKEAVSTSHNIAIVAFDADEVLAWRQGMYYIDNATLTELSAVLSRWYGCKVVVDTKEAAVQRFTGVLYKNQPVELMLKSIQLTNTIRYAKDEQGIIHIR
jgi:hypothetical protein